MEFDRIHRPRRGDWWTAGPQNAGALVAKDHGENLSGSFWCGGCDVCDDLGGVAFGGYVCDGVLSLWRAGQREIAWMYL